MKEHYDENWRPDTVFSLNPVYLANTIPNCLHGYYAETTMGADTFTFNSKADCNSISGLTVKKNNNAILYVGTGLYLDYFKIYNKNEETYYVISGTPLGCNGSFCRAAYFFIVREKLGSIISAETMDQRGFVSPVGMNLSHDELQVLSGTALYTGSGVASWLSDIDGDGLPELVTSLGNEHYLPDDSLCLNPRYQLAAEYHKLFFRQPNGQVYGNADPISRELYRAMPQALFRGYEIYFTDSIVVTWVAPEMPNSLRRAYGIDTLRR